MIFYLKNEAGFYTASLDLNLTKYIANERYRKCVHLPNGTIIKAHCAKTVKWKIYNHLLASKRSKSMNNRTRNAVNPIKNNHATNRKSDGWVFLVISSLRCRLLRIKSIVTPKTMALTTYPNTITNIDEVPNQLRNTVVNNKERYPITRMKCSNHRN